MAHPPADRSAIGYTDRGCYIRTDMAQKIDGYIERGEEVGHFLQAVICNDLHGAFSHGDAENVANLHAFISYFYNYAPSPCWGSKDKLKAWLERFQVKEQA